MQRKLTLIPTTITIKLHCGTTLPYVAMIPMYSYQLDESEAINCVYPEQKPIDITPCKVTTWHCAHTVNMSAHHPFDYVIANIYLRKILNNDY